VIVGAFIAAIGAHGIIHTWVPALWAERFGPSVPLRLGVALLGGAIMGYGARLAGGCTSGHGIFGLSNFELPSLIATISFMAGGIVTTQLVYRVIFG
jgi:uncharacterized membrane protein YedE/YeeE